MRVLSPHVDREHVRQVVAEIDGGDRRAVARQRYRQDHQDRADRDLAADQQAAKARAAQRAGAVAAQHVHQRQARRLERRQQREHQRRDRAHGEAEHEHTVVDIYRREAHQHGDRRRQRARKRRRATAQQPRSKRQARGTGQQRNQQAFGEQLTDEPSAAGAERQAHRNLAVPRRGPRQHHVGHVGTRRDEDQAKRRKHRCEHGGHLQRQRVGRCAFADVGTDVVGATHDTSHERGQPGLGLRRRRPRLQSRDDLDGLRLLDASQSGIQQLRVGDEGNPHVARRIAQPRELRAQNPEHGKQPPVDVDLPRNSGDVVSDEQSRPSLVAEHDAFDITLVAAPGASHEHGRTERLEVVVRNQRSRQRASVRRDEPRALGDGRLEHVAALTELLVLAPTEALPAVVARSPANLVQLLRIAHRVRSQHVGVDDRERDREESDADRQRQHRRHQKCAAAAQTAHAVAEILSELFEDDPHRPPSGTVPRCVLPLTG